MAGRDRTAPGSLETLAFYHPARCEFIVSVLASHNNGGMDQPDERDQDPAVKPRRRTFKAEKKLELLAEYDAADRDKLCIAVCSHLSGVD